MRLIIISLLGILLLAVGALAGDLVRAILPDGRIFFANPDCIFRFERRPGVNWIQVTLNDGETAWLNKECLPVAGPPSEKPPKNRTAEYIEKKLVVELEDLKTYQSSSKYSAIDFQITNRSPLTIKFLMASVDVFTGSRKYLGHTTISVSNLKVYDSKVRRALFRDVKASDIGRYRVKLERIIVILKGKRYDGSGQYVLRIK